MAAAKKSNSAPSDVMGFLNYYLVDKAPFTLPKGLVDFMVRFAPVAALILGILAAFGSLAVFGVSSILSPFVIVGGGVSALGTAFMSAIFLGITAVMYFMAYPALKARKLSGWTLLFYIQTLYIISDLVNVRIASAVLSALVGYYLLFQMRARYKK